MSKSTSSRKKVYADYFLAFSTRDVSGHGDVWRLYSEEDSDEFNPLAETAANVQIPGDLYLTPDKRHICSTYYPTIGPYDTWDDDLCEFHVLLARVTGIDGFLAEWSYEGMPRDRSMLTLAKAGAKYGFEVGANWCEYGHFSWRDFATREEAVEAGKNAFQYLLEEVYGKHCGPAIDGRPMVLLFDATDNPAPEVKFRGFTVEELAYVRRALKEAGHDPVIITRSNAGKMTEVVDGHYGWVDMPCSPVPEGEIWDIKCTRADNVQAKAEFNARMAKMKAEGKIEHFLASVTPGFDDHKGQAWGCGQKRNIPRDGGLTLTETFEIARQADTDMLFLVTWNDWEESSGVEPSRELGYQEIEICARQIAEWKGEPASMALLRVPEKLFHLRKKARLFARAGMAPETLAPLNEALDALGHALAERGEKAVTEKLGAAESVANALGAGVAAEAIDLFWEYSIPPCGVEAVLTEKPVHIDVKCVDGMALPGDPPRAGFRLSGDARTRITDGAFVGRLSFEYLDTGREFIKVAVDAPDEQHQTLAHFRKQGSGRWLCATLDLVNARFVQGLEGGADIAISQRNGDGGIRSLRITGTVYRAG